MRDLSCSPSVWNQTFAWAFLYRRSWNLCQCILCETLRSLVSATMVWTVGMADNNDSQGQNNKKKKRKRQEVPDETGTLLGHAS